MMKKIALLLPACAVCLWAADFWASKPYTEWSAKEVQKILADSPWAHRVDVELTVNMPRSTSISEAKGRGGGPREISTADGGQTSGADLNGTRGGAPGPTDGPLTQTLPIMLVWQTALPVKQALAKGKYGAEAGTSAEAKAVLERQEQFFVLLLEGLPVTAEKSGEADKKAALLEATTISVKGKEPLRAVEVQMGVRDKKLDAAFLFPRATPGASAPFSADDKELDFATRFDKLAVKYRFKLKDMVYHNKLEM